MKNFRFWQLWLFIATIYLSVFGLVLAFYNQSPLMNFLFNARINPAFWQSEIASENVAAFQSWTYGVLGATVSGWGIAMAFLVYHPFRSREKWAWDCLAGSLTIWYIADTAISGIYQVTFNVVLNTVLFLLFAIPLLFTKKHFQ